MKRVSYRLSALLALVAAASFGDIAQAAETDKSSLPGGASSLQEKFDDWQVVCVATSQARQCSLQQQQSESKSGRRVLAVEFRPSSGEGATGTLLMPFGLALDSGISLTRDEETSGQSARFETCLTTGCVVPVTLSVATLTSYRAGKQLKLTTKTTDGKTVVFSVSLKGFNAAFDRATALLK